MMLAVGGPCVTLELPPPSLRARAWRLELSMGSIGLLCMRPPCWQWKPCPAPNASNGTELPLGTGCFGLLRLWCGQLQVRRADRSFPLEQSSREGALPAASALGLDHGAAVATLVTQPDGNLTLTCPPGALCRVWVLVAGPNTSVGRSKLGSNGLARPIASSMRALRPGDRIRVGHVELAVRQLPAHGLPTTDGTGAWPAAPPSCLRTRKVCSISILVLAVDRALRSPLHVKASAPAVPHQRPHLNPPRPTTPAPYSADHPLPSLPTSLLPHPLSPRAHPFPSYPKPSHVLAQPVPARLHLLKPTQD